MKIAYSIIIQIDADKKSKEEVMELLKLRYPESKSIKRIKDFRTQQQSRALYLFFSQTAQEFNDKHITVKDFLGGSIELEFTPEIVKEIWRRIQKGAFNKKSTTELSKSGEIDFVYDALNLYVSERWRGEVVLPKWPSSEFFLTEPE